MTRCHTAFALGLLIACGAAVPLALAEPAATTVTGKVVDPGRYLREGAAGTAEQTYEAVDGGQSLALLADNGTLYLLVAERAGEDPNELVYDLVNKHVNVTGVPYERGGIKALVVKSADSLEPADAAEDEGPAEEVPEAEVNEGR